MDMDHTKHHREHHPHHITAVIKELSLIKTKKAVTNPESVPQLLGNMNTTIRISNASSHLPKEVRQSTPYCRNTPVHILGKTSRVQSSALAYGRCSRIKTQTHYKDDFIPILSHTRVPACNLVPVAHTHWPQLRCSTV